VAEGSLNEDVFGPSPLNEGLEHHDTKFTFTFHLNQEPPANMKRPNASEWAPTPHASPTKKRIRVSDDVIKSPSPEGFYLPEDREIVSRPSTPRSQTPCPTSPPHSSRYNSISPTNFVDHDSGPSSDISFEGPTVAVNSRLIAGKEPVTVRKGGSGPLKNAKLTSFWSLETVGEREGRVQREFAALRDEADANAMDEAHLQRLKLLRKRADDRERQQKHRDMVREKRVEAGWIPGKKRVSLRL
jgi:hypothetical protein